jgi:hypothetical protein
MIQVPNDLTAEQKTVLAVLSMRQFFLIAPVLVISVFTAILFNIPFLTGVNELMFKLVLFLIFNGITSALAFVKLSRYDCYLSQYIVIIIRFKQSKKLYTY